MIAEYMLKQYSTLLFFDHMKLILGKCIYWTYSRIVTNFVVIIKLMLHCKIWLLYNKIHLIKTLIISEIWEWLLIIMNYIKLKIHRCNCNVCIYISFYQFILLSAGTSLELYRHRRLECCWSVLDHVTRDRMLKIHL